MTASATSPRGKDTAFTAPRRSYYSTGNLGVSFERVSGLIRRDTEASSERDRLSLLFNKWVVERNDSEGLSRPGEVTNLLHPFEVNAGS